MKPEKAHLLLEELMSRRDQRASKQKQKAFVHGGGGCMVGSTVRYPCDDEYVRKDGARIVLATTMKAHFSMPTSVSGPAELKRLPGVGRVRFQNARKRRRR